MPKMWVHEVIRAPTASHTSMQEPNIYVRLLLTTKQYVAYLLIIVGMQNTPICGLGAEVPSIPPPPVHATINN